jgi:hypothetical protein
MVFGPPTNGILRVENIMHLRAWHFPIMRYPQPTISIHKIDDVSRLFVPSDAVRLELS